MVDAGADVKLAYRCPWSFGYTALCANEGNVEAAQLLIDLGVATVKCTVNSRLLFYISTWSLHSFQLHDLSGSKCRAPLLYVIFQ